jgi:cell shape-determining protein MreC
MVATRRRTLALLLAISLAQVLLISAQVQSRSGLPVIEAVAFGAFARIHLMAAAVAGGVRAVWSRYLALGGVARENDDLRERVVELEGRMQALEAESRTTRALEEVLGLQVSLDAPGVAARVIAGSPMPGEVTITIDRGTEATAAPASEPSSSAVVPAAYSSAAPASRRSVSTSCRTSSTSSQANA